MRPALFGAVIFGTTASLFAALPKERGQSQAESQAQSESQAPPGAKAGAGAQRSAADYQPNVELLTQEGKHVRFYDDLVKGRVVLINMMFTTCVSICPPMTANLLKVQRLLEARLGPRLGPRLWQDVRILSISVDPETDTPAVLKEYASRYQVGPGWYFLTGKKPEVDALLAKLGGQDPDKNRHSGMLLIGNDAARSWHKVFAMSEPADIENAVEKLLSLSAASP
jgi:protein SCO1/2